MSSASRSLEPSRLSAFFFSNWQQICTYKNICHVTFAMQTKLHRISDNSGTVTLSNLYALYKNLSISAYFYRHNSCSLLVIQLEARLLPNNGFTLRHALAVLMCSAITLPKVKWFWWNLAHCWGLALADFGRDPRSSESLRGKQNVVFFCPVGNISLNLNSTTLASKLLKTFRTEFWKFYSKESLFQKTKISHKISKSCDFTLP